MPAPFLLSFGDLRGARGLTFSFTRGITPSAFTLYCHPHDIDLPPSDLTFACGSDALTFRDCVIVSTNLRPSGLMPTMAVTGLDRRWRWQFSPYGDPTAWNVRRSNGTVDPNTQKTPGELADMLLTQLGESGFDTSRMPTGVFPRLKPDRADLLLASLCEDVACEVVLNYQTDKVEIWPLGVGSGTVGDQLPKYRHVPRNIPSLIEVHGGESLYQFRLKLQPIGRQSNLQEKTLSTVDWAAGLTNTESFNFPNLASNVTNRALALATAWRQYRVLGQENGALQVPFCPEPIASTEQYSLKPWIGYTVTDLNGKQKRLPYYVEGDFYPYSDLSGNVSNQVFLGPSTLDTERQLVEFPFPVVKLTSTGALDSAGATLYLQTAYGVKSVFGESVHLWRSGNLGGSGGKLVLRRPEVFAAYAPTGHTESQAATELDAYVALFQQKYANPFASEVTLPGLLPVRLDGNVAQITWNVSGINGLPSTKICEQEELDAFAIDRNERRRRERLAQLVEAAR